MKPTNVPDRIETEADDRFVFGIHPVKALLKSKADRVEKLYMLHEVVRAGHLDPITALAKEKRIVTERVQRERLSRMVNGAVHQGVVAEVRQFDYADFDDTMMALLKEVDDPIVVVLDGIQDPHNFGAIVRSAHALGAHAVVVAKDRAAPVTGVVEKASAGATALIPICRVVNLSRTLELLKKDGFWIAALEGKGQTLPWKTELTGKIALVVGGEGDGVRQGVLSHCDFQVAIPLANGFDSLNASTAATVLLYEARRQRVGHEQPKASAPSQKRTKKTVS